jgi:phosphorylcholine metabolism protein LicD
MKSEKYLKFLLQVTNILEKRSIPYWLDSGLLLSMYRNDTIADHLTHITLGVTSEYYVLLREYLSSVFILNYREVYDKSGFEWIDFPFSKIVLQPKIKLHGYPIRLEIIIKVKKGDSYRWVSGITCKEVDIKFYDQCDTMVYKGHIFPIPKYLEEYLETRYQVWKKPKKEWDSNFDDGARITRQKVNSLKRKSRSIGDKKYKQNKLTGKFLKQAESILIEITSFLEHHHIRYWLDFGTLLGIYRDGALIPWDNDADISIHGDDVEILWKVKSQLPFKYRLSPRYNSTKWIPGKYRVFKLKYWYQKPLRFLKRKELHIDIFVKYKVDNYYYWISCGSPKRVKSHYHDTSESINWHGNTYNIPSDTKKYLTELYGDWKTPIRNYDSSMEEGTICDTIQYK